MGAVVLLLMGMQVQAAGFLGFSITNVAETNLQVRLALPEDYTSYFTFEESTNLPGFSTRFTSLGGGTNAWNYTVLYPGGGVDPHYAWLGGGTNEWHFSTSADRPRIFWGVRRLPHSPLGTYFQFGYSLGDSNLAVRFDLTPDLANYYILEAGSNLDAFAPQAMAYGGGDGTWATLVITADVPEKFWRVRRWPAATALDTDGDGIDDVYELSHGLDPLAPADAALPSGYSDNAGVPLSWLEQYRYHFVFNTVLYNSVAREVSVFNFGQATANYEALGREVSVFNFGQPSANLEAVSRELSVFNSFPDTDGDGIEDSYEFNHGLDPLAAGDANLPSGFTDEHNAPLTWLELYRHNFGQNVVLFDAVSREVSAFNFGQSSAGSEAISREVSVFNSPPDGDGDGVDDSYETNHGLNPLVATDAALPSGFADDGGHALIWFELYRYNFGRDTILYNSVSREVSVFNFGQPTAWYEAVSREVSVFNIP